ncbi:MAG TPA: hypothetical protein VFW02_05105 [Candidatus Limnocylindrales bacterium]|nr:hypothetical protein [Candidatus Limnocylindrales bacterium]
MMKGLPRRIRLGFSTSHADESLAIGVPDQVDFVAYGADCILSGRAVLDADRLSDMLNSHDEYLVSGLSVERFDDETPFELDDEIAIPRDEIYLVHASGPRGDAARRHRTMPQRLAIKMGPYKVRGFFHALPGADPVLAFRRRKAMVPLTDGRIEYTFHGERRETTVDTVIVNREQIDWVEAVLPTQTEFPEGPKRLVPKPA